ncbi:ranBP-type and C3HC4-type zinc finger-containing 1 isoform X2 [Paramuricea clavata]|uniref:RanBP-type and C3HC4-type zinc finger-containing protein 1 n=1 Tax=Paramuricea clavata TaxID=317549 RepID=A0A7D9DYM3_PARCT|nr:ranBP-type and C3HC4-type zinc finger-containing 1 isoform X2 [Paramuricea clavata]
MSNIYRLSVLCVMVPNRNQANHQLLIIVYNLLIPDNICLTLSDAINRGDQEFASNLARQLAAQRATVKIRLDDPENDELTRGAKDNTINLKVQVEDKESGGFPFRVDVAPQMTIKQLRQMVQVKYGFPPEIQGWIISKRFAKPNESLSDCGIKASGHTVYLYLKSADSAGISRGPTGAWGERREAGINRANSVTDVHGQQNLQNDAPNVPRNDPRSLPNLPSEILREPPQPAVGWECPACTYVNPPSRPGCEICSAGRPQEYHIPDDYVPDDRERVRLQQAEFGEQLLLEEEERQKRSAMEERDRNFQQHMSVALRQPLIANQEETECPICFDTIPVGEGVVLRECLHIFCRECLAEHIKASQEPEVQCPYDNGDFQCHDVITNQEIQELLNNEDFQKYLQRSLATAESQEANSFHCQTPNCHGWCIYDDEVNDFDCPVCQQRNCLTCKAIHSPVNCKEYQDDLKRNAANDEAAKKTQEYLEHAFEAIREVNDIFLDGRALKASLGTTKYCTYFLKNSNCPKTDCMYLHALDNDGASFTKEEMQAGKHIEYEQMLLKKYEEKRKTSKENSDKWPTNSQEESTEPECRQKQVESHTELVNGGSPSPIHQAIPGNLKDTNEQFESWDEEISTQTSLSSLRPIGAEHRATTSAGVTHTGPFVSSYKVLDDMKHITHDLTGLGLSNLHIQDGGLSHEDDLGFDPWNESRKALADLIQEETVSYPEHSAVNPTSQFTNHAAPAPHNTVPPAPSNCTPTAEEMEFLQNWKAGLQALLPNINISFADAFSPPSWHAGDANGSSSLSYNSQAGFKPFTTPNSQTQGDRPMRPPPGFESQNNPFLTDLNTTPGFPVSHGM